MQLCWAPNVFGSPVGKEEGPPPPPPQDGLWTEAHGQQKPSNDPSNNQHNPQYANYWVPLTRKRHIPPHSAQPKHTNHWAPRTRKRHQQEHRPQRPTERSAPTQHAEGRTGDCPGPRKETTTRRNVTRGAGGGGLTHNPLAEPLPQRPGLSSAFAPSLMNKARPPPPHTHNPPHTRVQGPRINPDMNLDAPRPDEAVIRWPPPRCRSFTFQEVLRRVTHQCMGNVCLTAHDAVSRERFVRRADRLLNVMRLQALVRMSIVLVRLPARFTAAQCAALARVRGGLRGLQRALHARLFNASRVHDAEGNLVRDAMPQLWLTPSLVDSQSCVVPLPKLLPAAPATSPLQKG